MNSEQTYLDIFNTIDFEKIKDHPNILIAANFWELERYRAAKVCYKFMRAIDDLIDDHKGSFKEIADHEKASFEANVDSWIKMIIASGDQDPLQKELIETIQRFQIPSWPLEAFAKSMIYDIHHDGFKTLQSFLEYAGGASVAPASIFVHLCGIQKKDGDFSEPPFNLKEASTPCAVFSYLVHIIRDFQKDQLHHLNYFADDLIEKHNLTKEELKSIAHGGAVSQGFRNMIHDYLLVADEYRLKTYQMIQQINPYLEPRYRLSLEIIFNLYLMVFERIDFQNGNFTTQELNPTAEETKKRVYETIIKFNEQ